MQLMFIGGKRIWVSRKNLKDFLFFFPFCFLDNQASILFWKILEIKLILLS